MNENELIRVWDEREKNWIVCTRKNQNGRKESKPNFSLFSEDWLNDSEVRM